MKVSKRRRSCRDANRNNALNALFPRIRRTLLKRILTRPGEWNYMSRLAAELGTTPSALQREIPSLIRAGILRRREDDSRRVYVTANHISPLYRNLRGLFERPVHRRCVTSSRKNSSSLAGPSLSPKLVVRYDREKLYQQVWSQPVQQVAKAYGISGVALAKTCRKLRVPVPGRGYWAKLAAGKTVALRPSLPPAPEPNNPATAAALVAHDKMGKVMLCPAGHRTTIPAKDRKRKIVCPTCGQGARSLRYFLQKARLGGLRGGKARAARLTAEQRRESARNAVLARWARKKLAQKNHETAATTSIAA